MPPRFPFSSRAFSTLSLVLVVSGCAMALPSSPATAASTARVSLLPVADAYVTRAQARTNYGKARELRVDARPLVRSYLRFRVRGPSTTVRRAVLRLYAKTTSRVGFSVRRVSGKRWRERTLTYRTAPAVRRRPARTVKRVRAARWVTVDVTPLVRADAPLSLALTTRSGVAVRLASRESARAPRLVVEFAPVPPSASRPDPVLIAAGDIASCSSSGDEATAELLDAIPGTVATLGDNVYDSGTATEFANCYEPSWGRHKARTRPAVGNHEYGTPGASGYFGYFGAPAGPAGKGYYSYQLGRWHVVVLNSVCSQVGGCGAGSPQEQWLRSELAANTAACTLAYWHHPRFSSGTRHGSSAAMQAFWQALYDAGADVVLSAHEHNYERFAAQDATGRADRERGIREFVVGTGGKSLYPLGAPIANSEVRNADAFGVLKLTLHATSYDWQFVPEAGKTFTDSGSGACH